MRGESYMRSEPIVALATPWAPSAIAVIRGSGEGCVALLARLLSYPFAHAPVGVLNRGILGDPDSQENIDEVMAVRYDEKSYTGEESFEVFCHGSLAGIERILALLYAQGFRQASPGEFTYRAFLNGKLDLTRAEAVQDIVHSRSHQAQSLALDRLLGGVEKKVCLLRDRAVKVAAALAVQLDYPEEEVPYEGNSLQEDLDFLQKEVALLLGSYRVGKIFSDGVPVVLTGASNAGKSSLFNLLLREERSIVSPSPGTTRDYLDCWVNLDGLPIRLYDTAGLRDAQDEVEREGIRRSAAVLEEAHLVLHVIDGENPVLPDEEFTKGSTIFVWNKIDTASSPPPSYALGLCCSSAEGLKELEQAIKAAILEGNAPLEGRTAINSKRQKELLESCAESLGMAKRGLAENQPADVISVEVQGILQALGEITGEVHSKDILEEMFSEFCLGK